MSQITSMSRITDEMAREGLRTLMAHRRLSNIADAALAWLHEQGAQYLYEVITVIDDLADHVKLKVLDKKEATERSGGSRLSRSRRSNRSLDASTDAG